MTRIQKVFALLSQFHMLYLVFLTGWKYQKGGEIWSGSLLFAYSLALSDQTQPISAPTAIWGLKPLWNRGLAKGNDLDKKSCFLVEAEYDLEGKNEYSQTKLFSIMGLYVWVNRIRFLLCKTIANGWRSVGVICQTKIILIGIIVIDISLNR